MDRAREVAANPTSLLPAAIVADRQLAGRGQRAASWWQPPGSLAVSLVVAQDSAGSIQPPVWSLACGVAVAETICLLEPTVAATVRWPNDIEVDGRKLAGILVEASLGRPVIFGIGVNTTGSARLAPAGIASRVATLPDLTGRPMPRQQFLAEFVPRLRFLLDSIAHEPEMFADHYRSFCSLTGRQIVVYVAGIRHEGTCGGIAPDGRLILDTPAGEMRIVSGSLTPPYEIWRGDG